MAGVFGLLVALLLFAADCRGAIICTEPSIVPSYYTTSNAIISEDMFIIEISLTCSNGAQNVPLYADVNAKWFPLISDKHNGKYRVMWSIKDKNAHYVKIFDEDSYNLMKEAKKNKEVVSIKPLFSVDVEYGGIHSLKIEQHP